MSQLIRPLLLLVLLLLSACGGDAPPPTAPSVAAPTLQDTAHLPPAFDVQGHRGARGLRPENTRPAFETALDLGVTTLELDLHYTQDGRVIVWHDPIIGKDNCRLPDGADAPDPAHPITVVQISAEPLDTIQQYQCDRNPDSRRFPDQQAAATPLAGSDYRILSLEELFTFVDTYAQSEQKTAAQRDNAARVHFNIETKRVPDLPRAIGDGFDGTTLGPFEEAILTAVEQHNLTDRVTVQSFDHRSLAVIRAVNDEISLAALTSRSMTPDPAAYAAAGYNIWSPDHNTLTADLLTTAQNNRLRVIPWTVNDPADMRALIDRGVDGLITDFPDRLLDPAVLPPPE